MSGNNQQDKRQLIATLKLRSLGKGKMNTAGGVRVAKETIRNRLRSSGEGITISVSGEMLQVYSDGRTYIPESRWNVIKSYMARHGITFEAELPNRRQKSYEILFDENESLKRQIGEIGTRVEEAERKAEEWKGLADSYRTDADDGKKTISDMRGSMHLFGLFDSHEIEEPFDVEMGPGLAEKLAKGQIKAVSATIKDAEDAIEECAKSCQIDRKEIYRIMSMGLRFEETKEYKGLKEQADGAVAILKQVESNPSMTAFVDVEKAKGAVEKFEAKKKNHGDVTHLVDGLVGHREIHYLLESGETDDNHFINLYIPVAHKEDLKSVKRVEADLYMIAIDSIGPFYHSGGELHGAAINFNLHNSNGVVYYQFRMPKSKVDRKTTEEIKEKFKKNIIESQKNTIIYKLGVRVMVSELTSFGEDSDDKVGYIEPPAPLEEPRPERMGIDDVVYRKISSRLEEKGIKSFDDPRSLFIRPGYYTPEAGALRVAILLSITTEAASRGYIVDFVERTLPELGKFKRGNVNKVDLAVKGLLNMGILEKSERGSYSISKKFYRQ